MLKLNKKRLIAFFSILMSISLTACTDSKEKAPAGETIAQAKEEKKKVEVQTTLAEQGFILDSYEIDPAEGVVLVKLKGPKGEYFGMMDSNFKWVLKPQNMEVILETESSSGMEHERYFSEGVMRVGIHEDRDIRADRGRYEEWKWGYMDTKGEWIIEPAYRNVSAFSNGLAIVTTIEEDRDDLSNARQIVIDQKGNEVFELISTYNISERPDEDYEYQKFSHGYLKTYNGFYDTSGKFYKTDFVESGEDSINYEVINNQIITIENGKVSVYDVSGKLVKALPLSAELDAEPGNLFTSEELAKENKFMVGWSNNNARLMDLDGKVYGGPIKSVVNDELIGYAAPYLFIPEEVYDEETEEYESTIVIYNYDGEKVVSLPSEAKSVHSSRYWIEGKEYDKFLSFDGQILLDEDKKVVTDHKGHLEGSVITVKRRMNPNDPELTEVLLNTDTFETITIDEILNK